MRVDSSVTLTVGAALLLACFAVAVPLALPAAIYAQAGTTQEAIRTPMILAGKGVPKGRKCGAPVENVDLYPTLCRLAGIAPPRSKDGRPELEGRDLTHRMHVTDIWTRREARWQIVRRHATIAD